MGSHENNINVCPCCLKEEKTFFSLFVADKSSFPIASNVLFTDLCEEYCIYTDFAPDKDKADQLFPKLFSCRHCGFIVCFSEISTLKLFDSCKNEVIVEAGNTSGLQEYPLLNKYVHRAKLLDIAGAKAIDIASTYLYAAWLCTYIGNVEKERSHRCETIKYIKIALEREVLQGEKAILTYLVGELYRRIGELDNANLWFDQVEEEITDRDAQTWVVLLARLQKFNPQNVLPEPIMSSFLKAIGQAVDFTSVIGEQETFEERYKRVNDLFSSSLKLQENKKKDRISYRALINSKDKAVLHLQRNKYDINNRFNITILRSFFEKQEQFNKLRDELTKHEVKERRTYCSGEEVARDTRISYDSFIRPLQYHRDGELGGGITISGNKREIDIAVDGNSPLHKFDSMLQAIKTHLLDILKDRDELRLPKHHPDKRYCTSCGSQRVARILYGLISTPYDKGLKKDLDAGKVVLGGCCITDESGTHRCLECGKERGGGRSLTKPNN